MCAGDGAAQVVGHNGRGHPADERKCTHLGAEPVGQLLTQGGFGVGVVRAAQYRDEDLCLTPLAGVTVGDRHGLSGVVDKQLFTGRMVLAQHQVLSAQPAPVAVAEHAVLPALGVLSLVLLPQQPARDATARELSLNIGEVWLRALGHGNRALV